MVGDNRIVSDICGVPYHSEIRKYCISADVRILAGNGIFANPCKTLLVEIILGFDKAAQITSVNIFGQIYQRPDAVQFRVVRVGNVGDFVFFHPHRASPRLGLFLFFGVSSVSTYSEIMPSASA